MKFEEFKQPIQVNSTEEHEEILEKRILQIQFEYIDKLFSRKIPPLNEDIDIHDFKRLLKRYSGIGSRVMRYRHDQNSEQKLKTLNEGILDKITILHKENPQHWAEEAENLLKQELKKYRDDEKGQKQNNAEDKLKAGIIHFEINSVNEERYLPKETNLSINDRLLEIHLESLFKQKDGNIKNLFSSNSLGELAIKIVDEYPEVKAVIAMSWLIDTPIAKRIGFTVYDRRPDPSGNDSFWGQFVDSDGQIKQEEVKKFFKTGISQYKTAIGIIMVEDFLKKYLPTNRRGKVILKEANPNIVEIEEKRKKETDKLNNFFTNWNEKKQEDIKSLFKEMEIFNDFINTKEGAGLSDLFLELKKNNEDIEKIRQNPKLKEYKNLFKKYINSLEFSNREVVI